MREQNKASGVVLAGGAARRMGHQDKGLIMFRRRPLVSYALTAMEPLVDQLLISANRNQAFYRKFGYPLIGDANPNFEGPLAGILAAMQAAKNPVLLVAPCDSPLMQTSHLHRLLSALKDDDVDIATAFDGRRVQPVFAALRTCLQNDLRDYLRGGERKLEYWFNRHSVKRIDFSDCASIFANINTPEDLKALEASMVFDQP